MLGAPGASLMGGGVWVGCRCGCVRAVLRPPLGGLFSALVALDVGVTLDPVEPDTCELGFHRAVEST